MTDHPDLSLFFAPATALVAACALVFASAFPLATYAASLATFGLIHVSSEFRYVDRRFGRRLARQAAVAIGALLVGVVVVRTLRVTDAVPTRILNPLELGVVVALALSVIPALARAGRGRLTIGLTVVAALVAGIAISPIYTIVVFAILHNATPLGFFAEAARDGQRRKVIAVGVVYYFAIPAFIATGLPGEALARLGIGNPEAALFPVGPLVNHLGAYLPPSAAGTSWATAAFSACVFAQLMHYWATIVIMPRLAGAKAPTLLPWPSGPLFLACVLIPAAVLLAVFVQSFAFARGIYSVAAGVHAWVEVPLLLFAMTAFGARASSAIPSSAGAASGGSAST